MRTSPCLLLAAGLALQPVSAAQAQHAVRVAYHDLDLASAEGIAALDARLARAATRVCDSDGSADLASKLDARQCRKEVLAGIANHRDQLVARAASVRMASARAH